MFFYLEDSQKKDRNVNYHLMVQVLKALREYQHLDDISGKFFLNYEERLTGILMLPPDEKEETLREKTEKLLQYVKEVRGFACPWASAAFVWIIRCCPSAMSRQSAVSVRKSLKRKKI